MLNRISNYTTAIRTFNFFEWSTRNNLYFRVAYYIFVHILALAAFKYGTITTFITFLLFWWFGAFAVSGYTHRALSHRSIIIRNSKLEHLCNWFAIYAGIGTPLGWAALHRMHHTYLDTDKDPHSPWRIGFWRSYLHLWDWKKEDVELKMAAGLFRNRIAVYYHNRAVPVLFMFWGGLFIISEFIKVNLGILGGLEVCIGAAIAVVAGLHGMGVTNAVSHSGHSPKEVVSLEPMSGAFINWGEGNHEYHHAKPMDYSFGAGISDPVARTAEVFEKLKLLEIKRAN